MTFTQRYSEGNGSLELRALVAERAEDPIYSGSDNDGNELWRFPDGTEVISTNAGLCTTEDPGFAEVRAEILS
jgi:hypothetical protein